MAKYIINDLRETLHYLPYGLILGVLVMLVLNLVNSMREQKGKKTIPMLSYGAFFMYAAIILCITFLSRESGSRDGIDLDLFSTWGNNPRNHAYVVENVLLFIPLGFVCPWTFKVLRNFFACTLFGAAASTAIECLQLLTKRGFFQIDDILTNTLGMAIGCILFWIFKGLGRLLGFGRTKEAS
ncbi:MAG: VanZ family protein [Bacteroidales bacterium]|nr:VanZ family protein [Lachnoclostridium sp.]MCM1384051.1 VanZ family protein [Lachnoclostridium sp.]MCM1465441.1 VanZ family protein [Bacteroidales bacterium]